MKLARCFSLVLVAAARAQRQAYTHCRTELADFQECVQGRGPKEEAGCIDCLQLADEIDDEAQRGAAEAACAATGAACDGCAAHWSALSACGTKLMM